MTINCSLQDKSSTNVRTLPSVFCAWRCSRCEYASVLLNLDRCLTAFVSKVIIDDDPISVYSSPFISIFDLSEYTGSPYRWFPPEIFDTEADKTDESLWWFTTLAESIKTRVLHAFREGLTSQIDARGSTVNNVGRDQHITVNNYLSPTPEDAGAEREADEQAGAMVSTHHSFGVVSFEFTDCYLIDNLGWSWHRSWTQQVSAFDAICSKGCREHHNSHNDSCHTSSKAPRRYVGHRQIWYAIHHNSEVRRNISNPICCCAHLFLGLVSATVSSTEVLYWVPAHPLVRIHITYKTPQKNYYKRSQYIRHLYKNPTNYIKPYKVYKIPKRMYHL